MQDCMSQAKYLIMNYNGSDSKNISAITLISCNQHRLIGY